MNSYIRRALLRDQAAIRSLIREAGINPMHLHWQHFIVVQDRYRIAGCGQLRPHKDGSAELASIAVTPAQQGRGIGAAIVETLIDIHAGNLFLMCEGKMQPFYERYGFAVAEATELPSEMRINYRMGSAFTWAARTLFRQQVRILAMRCQGTGS